jgi:predicted Zn-dependent protease
MNPHDYCLNCNPHRLTRADVLRGMGAVALTTASALALPATAFADEHDQERQIGQQVYTDLRNKNQILDTSPYYPILRAVGGKIAAVNQPRWYPQNWIVVKGAQANAFSVPGGNIYVNEALLKNAENEDELASVLGHETGHLVLGHVMDRIHKAQTAQIVGGILGIFIHNQGTYDLVNFLGSYAFLNFSRAQEYQADHEGVILAGKAAYNPWGMVWFFQKLTKLYGDSGFEQYVQDHPATSDRISRIEQFFNSDPTQFGKWQNKMTSTAGLSTSTGSDAKLILTQS